VSNVSGNATVNVTVHNTSSFGRLEHRRESESNARR
jgi:hypothetical protein